MQALLKIQLFTITISEQTVEPLSLSGCSLEKWCKGCILNYENHV